MDNATTEPVLIEQNKGFTTHWHCAVPDKGVKFRVLRDHWLETTPPVREIHEIEITDQSSSW